MQGRRGQDREPWEQDSNDYPGMVNKANGTGKLRAGSSRSADMARLDSRRVSRSLREEQPPRRRRGKGRFLLIGIAVVICGVLAFMGGFAACNLWQGINVNSGAAGTAASFLGAVGQKDYAQAYSYLGAPITLTPTAQSDFTSQATQADSCFGQVTDYNEIQDSAVQQNTGWSYSYTITRTKLKQTYPMQLTLQQDSNGQWRITDFKSGSMDRNLAPTIANCA